MERHVVISGLHYVHPGASIRAFCHLIGVSRSWFYDRPAGDPKDLAIRVTIEPIVLEFPGHGYRRVTHMLAQESWLVNHKRVLRLMREESLPWQLRWCFVPTTDLQYGYRRY